MRYYIFARHDEMNRFEKWAWSYSTRVEAERSARTWLQEYKWFEFQVRDEKGRILATGKSS